MDVRRYIEHSIITHSQSEVLSELVFGIGSHVFASTFVPILCRSCVDQYGCNGQRARKEHNERARRTKRTAAENLDSVSISTCTTVRDQETEARNQKASQNGQEKIPVFGPKGDSRQQLLPWLDSNTTVISLLTKRCLVFVLHQYGSCKRTLSA